MGFMFQMTFYCIIGFDTLIVIGYCIKIQFFYVKI